MLPHDCEIIEVGRNFHSAAIDNLLMNTQTCVMNSNASASMSMAMCLMNLMQGDPFV